MSDKMKVREGNDGYCYPYTSPDIVIDENGKSVTTKFEELDSQFKDIAKKTIIEDNKLYLVKSDGTKLDEGTTLSVNSSSSVITNKFYKTESIGQLYEQPGENKYIAWCPGDLRYDKNLDKYIMLAFCCDKHVNATIQEVYQIVISPYTYETSKPVKIKMLDTDGDTDITPVKFGCCSYIILNDGTYLMINQIDNVCYKFTSTDNGLTWVKQNTVTGYSGAPWGMYELSNGRIIISDDVANVGLWYSDDKCDTWTNVKPNGTPGDYNAEGCILELGNNKLICIARKNMTGSGGYAPNNNNYSGASEHAIISYSNDNGTTWTAWEESNSIDNMNASCCTGIVHDDIVEIFACSRWYVTQNYENTDHANTGKCGAITHYTATIENALNDNFTNKGIITYSNAVGNNSSQDFHSPCLSKDKNDNILLVYFDRIGNGVEEKTNHYFIRGSLDALKYKPVDDFPSTVFAYTGKKVDKKLSNLKTELIVLINEAINSGTPITPPSSGDEPIYIPTTDKLVINFDFLDDSKADKTAMSVTSKVGDLTGCFRQTDNLTGDLVLEFPTNVNGKYLDFDNYNKRFIIPSLNNLIDITNDFTMELSLYMGEVAPNIGQVATWSNNGTNSTRFGSTAQPLYYTTDGNYKYNLTSIYWDKCKNSFAHLIVIIHNDGSYDVYLNNVLSVSALAPSDFSKWDERILSNPVILKCNMIALKFYNKALTLDEINNNYNYELNKYNI